MAEGICGCCGGIGVETPAAAFNRAGLASISVRTGTYASFLATMLARLSSSEHGELSDLRTRDPSVDFSIATIDAWAVVGDILSLYAERLTAEALLPTAREVYSLHQLAGLVSYAPHPGVAASAELAFRLSGLAGAPRAITLPSGVKVQSTPGPDETPVIFETSEAIPARPAWNAMRPRLDAVQALTATTTELALAGTQTGLKAGDGIAFAADDGTPVFAVIRSVRIVPANPSLDPDAVDLTHLVIDPTATPPLSFSFAPPPAPAVPALPPLLEAHLGETLDSGALTEILEDAKVSDEAIFDPLAGAPEAPKRILVFRQSSGVFGNAAPSLDSLPPSMTGDVPVFGTDEDGNIIITGLEPGPYKNETDATWADGTLEVLDGPPNSVFLDRTLKDVAAGSSVVLIDGEAWGLYTIDAVAETALARFAIQMRCLRLDLDSDDGFNTLTTRGTAVYLASAWLDLPRRPVFDALRTGDTGIELNTWAPGIQPGQRLALRGRHADGLDAEAVEMAEIAAVTHAIVAGGSTTITLASGLTLDHDRHALRINGNVAPATHGETTEDVLGAGDPTRPFPTLRARQGPLTHVTAPVAGGAAPEVELRVGGILWQPVANFLDVAQGARVFTIRTDQDGIATFGFGDGVTGAMPATGQEIRVTYRTGLGLTGRVRAKQLNVLMTRPLGVEEAENVLPADGGADPEPLEALRANVPLSCRTLGRVVALSDYADYARASAGIAKARAERVQIPGLGQPGIVVTIAGEEGADVLPGSPLFDNLNAALRNDGIPYARFLLRNFRPRQFRLGATIKVLPEFIAADVLNAAEAALRRDYGFDARDFARPVFASEVATTLQLVPGVEAVVLDLLYLGALPDYGDRLLAEPATPGAGAELLTLHPGPLDHLELMS